MSYIAEVFVFGISASKPFNDAHRFIMSLCTALQVLLQLFRQGHVPLGGVKLEARIP